MEKGRRAAARAAAARRAEAARRHAEEATPEAAEFRDPGISGDAAVPSTSGRDAAAAAAASARLPSSVGPAEAYHTGVRTLDHARADPIARFPRQAPALAWWDSQVAALTRGASSFLLFSEEVETAPRGEPTAPAARQFVVTTPAKVLVLMTERARSERRPAALYEIIRDGRPCHLYLDVEFARGGPRPGGVDDDGPAPVAPSLNADVDGDAVVSAAVAAVADQLRAEHGLSFHPDVDVWEADASTDERFSRHVTIRVRGRGRGGEWAWASTAAVGAFLSRAWARAAEAEGVGARLPGERGHVVVPRALRVSPPPQPDGGPGAVHLPRWVSAVDMAVYTRNRAFRLPGAAKLKRPEAPLLPTRRWAGAAWAPAVDAGAGTSGRASGGAGGSVWVPPLDLLLGQLASWWGDAEPVGLLGEGDGGAVPDARWRGGWTADGGGDGGGGGGGGGRGGADGRGRGAVPMPAGGGLCRRPLCRAVGPAPRGGPVDKRCTRRGRPRRGVAT